MSTSGAPKQEQGSRRGSRRAVVLQTGTLVFGAENSALECQVLDISDGGAKIHAANLPDSADVFDLRLDSGTTYRCRVVWRDKQNLGIEFVGEVTPNHGDVLGRRKHPRDSTLRQGQIVFQNGHCTIDCAILDLSKSGAKIRPRDLVACPEIFELRVNNGPTHPCKIVRRQGNVLGVHFLDLDD